MLHRKMESLDAGMMMESFAEGLNLAKEVDVDQSVLLDIISMSAIASPMLKLKVTSAGWNEAIP